MIGLVRANYRFVLLALLLGSAAGALLCWEHQLQRVLAPVWFLAVNWVEIGRLSPVPMRLDERNAAVGRVRDQFPVGMRVLAVDDDPVCLKVLENLLQRCQYHGKDFRDTAAALSFSFLRPASKPSIFLVQCC